MSMTIIKQQAKRGLVLTAFFLVLACRADERNYSSLYTENYADAATAPQSETVKVAFENLPKMQDDRVDINIVVTGGSSAVEYKYALLSGDAAKGGSSACIKASYSEFVPLTQRIKRNELPEGHHLLCAKGKSVHGATQQAPSTFAWLIDTSMVGAEEETEPAVDGN